MPSMGPCFSSLKGGGANAQNGGGDAQNTPDAIEPSSFRRKPPVAHQVSLQVQHMSSSAELKMGLGRTCFRVTCIEDSGDPGGRYEFDMGGTLRDLKTGQSFKFISQQHYDELSQKILDFVQNILLDRLLERRYTPKGRVPVWTSGGLGDRTEKIHPAHVISTRPSQMSIATSTAGSESRASTTGSITSTVYHAKRLRNAPGVAGGGMVPEPRKLMLLIQGSGRVRAGTWGCALCINSPGGLFKGTVTEYCERGYAAGTEILILNPNESAERFGDKTELDEKDLGGGFAGLSPQVAHCLECWDTFAREEFLGLGADDTSDEFVFGNVTKKNEPARALGAGLKRAGTARGSGGPAGAFAAGAVAVSSGGLEKAPAGGVTIDSNSPQVQKMSIESGGRGSGSGEDPKPPKRVTIGAAQFKEDEGGDSLIPEEDRPPPEIYIVAHSNGGRCLVGLLTVLVKRVIAYKEREKTLVDEAAAAGGDPFDITKYCERLPADHADKNLKEERDRANFTLESMKAIVKIAWTDSYHGTDQMKELLALGRRMEELETGSTGGRDPTGPGAELTATNIDITGLMSQSVAPLSGGGAASGGEDATKVAPESQVDSISKEEHEPLSLTKLQLQYKTDSLTNPASFIYDLLGDPSKSLNFVPHAAPVGTPVREWMSLKSPWESGSRHPLTCVSAGIEDHASTNFGSCEKIFSWFEEIN